MPPQRSTQPSPRRHPPVLVDAEDPRTLGPTRICVLMRRSFFAGDMGNGYQRFRTTSQNFYAYDTKALAVGESNQGIVVRLPVPLDWRRPRTRLPCSSPPPTLRIAHS